MMTLYGFRIVGPCTGDRRLIVWHDAFSGYAALDNRAEVHREAYLSAFAFDEDFRQHLESLGTTKGFAGITGSPFLWFDIDDADDLDRARRHAIKLAQTLVERYEITERDFVLFFSGAKGFHIGLPTSLWAPEPSPNYDRIARRFAEGLAESAGITIDTGVYDKVRAFRAPNSRHHKTGLYKRRFSLDELIQLSAEAILELTAAPAAFDVPNVVGRSDKAAADWQAAEDLVAREAAAKAQRLIDSKGTPTLNRQTLEFIRDGANNGDRHRLLFSAAANLGEFDCPAALAHALLTEAALDSGLPPSEVRRQIDCGLGHVHGSGREPTNA